MVNEKDESCLITQKRKATYGALNITKTSITVMEYHLQTMHHRNKFHKAPYYMNSYKDCIVCELN